MAHLFILELPSSLRIVTESGAVKTTFSPGGVAGHEDAQVCYDAATGLLRLTTPNEWRCHDGVRRFRWNGFPGEDFTTDVILYQ